MTTTDTRVAFQQQRDQIERNQQARRSVPNLTIDTKYLTLPAKADSEVMISGKVSKQHNRISQSGDGLPKDQSSHNDFEGHQIRSLTDKRKRQGR